MQTLWGHIGKYTVEKYRTNASLHPLMPALWGHIWKPTVKKSQTNAASVIMHPFTHPFEDTFENAQRRNATNVIMYPPRQAIWGGIWKHACDYAPRMHILKSWMIELDFTSQTEWFVSRQFLQSSSITELFVASVTFVWLLSSVDEHVSSQISSLIEWFVANGTLMWLFFSVCHHVFPQNFSSIHVHHHAIYLVNLHVNHHVSRLVCL